MVLMESDVWNSFSRCRIFALVGDMMMDIIVEASALMLGSFYWEFIVNMYCKF